MVENEIPYLRWSEFRQMAPPILQLEVTRLEGVMAGTLGDLDRHNLLVRARYEILRFIDALGGAEQATAGAVCAPPLRAALVAVTAAATASDDEEEAATLRYVLDRLAYVLDRLPLVY